MMINFKIKIIIRIESRNLTKELRYTMFFNFFLAGIGTLCIIWKIGEEILHTWFHSLLYIYIELLFTEENWYTTTWLITNAKTYNIIYFIIKLIVNHLDLNINI